MAVDLAEFESADFAIPLILPVALLVAWFIQRRAIILLEIQSSRASRRHKLLTDISSWFGTLVHELSHAIVLLLSGHGIKSIQVRPGQGEVRPRRSKDSLAGFLSFLVAALAPFFLPATAFSVALLLIGEVSWIEYPRGTSLSGDGELLLREIGSFLLATGWLLLNLDLATLSGLAILVILLVTAPAGKPSYVQGSKYHGENDQGDLAVVARMLKKHPSRTLILVALMLLPGLFIFVFPLVAWSVYGSLLALAVVATFAALLLAGYWTCLAITRNSKPFWIYAPSLLALLTTIGLHGYSPLEPILCNVAGALVLVVLSLIGRTQPKYRIPNDGFMRKRRVRSS